MSRLLLIIPAFNEAASIGGLLDEIRATQLDCDTVVIDDGSRDRTAAVVLRHEGVVVVRTPFNLGIGGAMQTGYRYAYERGYDIAVQVDADGRTLRRRFQP